MKADFDIGNLLYILLMIVFIIAGAFGKKKKPKIQKLPGDEPFETASPDDLLELKLKELFGENTGTVLQNEPPEGIPVSDIIDVVPDEVVNYPLHESIEYQDMPEPFIEKITESVEFQGEVIDSIGQEEGIAAFNYSDLEQITDEIVLSEGKEIVSMDYNEELLEFQEDFNARKGFIYSEIMNRKEYY